jgi:hypothetical protein
MWVMGAGAFLTLVTYRRLKQGQVARVATLEAQINAWSLLWSRWSGAPAAKPLDLVALRLLVPLGAGLAVAAAAASFPALPWVLGSAAFAASAVAADPAGAPALGLSLLACGAAVIAVPRLPFEPLLLGIGVVFAVAGELGGADLGAKLGGALFLSAVVGRPRILAMLAAGAVAAQTAAAAEERALDVATALCGAALFVGAGSASLRLRQLLGVSALTAAVLLCSEFKSAS